MRRSSGVSSLISCRAAALGNSSSNAVRSSGDISFRIPTTCSCAMARNNFCCASRSRYSKTSAASACGRTRKMITCSSSGRSRITSATSAGGHSRNTSRSAPKLRASIRLLISGAKSLPTMGWMFVRECRRVLTPGFAERNRACQPERRRGICCYYCSVAELRLRLEFARKRSRVSAMPAILSSAMIRREIGDDHICLLTFDRPESGANIFDSATLNELDKHLDFVESDTSLRGLMITSAKKSIFIAGADLKTLSRQAQTGEMRDFIADGQRILNRIAALKIPTVAAIHGACAGGGYEVTLACDHRIATDDPATRMGLPETTLGLIPAWGGCTRLPRLIGPERAAEVISKGKLYPAQEALKIGLIDEITLRDQLVDLARKKLREGKRKVSVAPKIDQEIPAPGNHNPAPARALEIIKKGLFTSTEQSLAFELDAIVDLGKTESTQNLIRNFFLAEKYKKGPSRVPAQKVVHAAVIGAGVMGSGIAQWLSSHGVTVILRDIAREQIDRGLANIEKTYADAVKRGLMREEKAKEGRARIVASTAPMELRDVQFVIEAASEKIDIKKEIFCELAMQAGPKTIIATNTSALPIGELADVTVLPEHVIGLHFFNPVSRMKLVEVVVANQTSDDTRAITSV